MYVREVFATTTRVFLIQLGKMVRVCACAVSKVLHTGLRCLLDVVVVVGLSCKIVWQRSRLMPLPRDGTNTTASRVCFGACICVGHTLNQTLGRFDCVLFE